MKLEDVTIGMRVNVNDPALLEPETEQCIVYEISKSETPWPVSIEMHTASGIVTKGYVSHNEIEPYAEPVSQHSLEEAADVLACGLVQSAGYTAMTLLPIAYHKQVSNLSYKAVQAIADLMNALDEELISCFDEVEPKSDYD